MKIRSLAIVALLVVLGSHPPVGDARHAPSSAQMPVIVIPDDPTVQKDWAAVNHFRAALRDLDVHVVDSVEPGDVALEVVVQCVDRANGPFHIVVAAISYLKPLADQVESRTRPALAMNSGSGELRDLVRTMAEDVFDILVEVGATAN